MANLKEHDAHGCKNYLLIFDTAVLLDLSSIETGVLRHSEFEGYFLPKFLFQTTTKAFLQGDGAWGSKHKLTELINGQKSIKLDNDLLQIIRFMDFMLAD